MIPLAVLVVVTFLTRLAGRFVVNPLDSWPAATRVGLAVMFCFTALAHFNAMRQDMINMVPPWVPDPGLVVTFTGVAEILGAIGLLVPAPRVAAAVGLVLLLISVLPANVHAALNAVPLRGQPPAPLWPRVGLQVLFIALVAWSGIVRPRR